MRDGLGLRAAAAMVAAMLATVPAGARADDLAPIGRWSAYSAGAAQRPPMGWSSWNAFYEDISEEKVLASAKIIVDSGLAAKGYRDIDMSIRISRCISRNGAST